MIIKEKAESLTMAYIHSYNLAMKEMRNSDFANQIAANIVFVIAKTESKTEQPMFNPFEMVLKNVMENIKTQKEEENSKEKEV